MIRIAEAELRRRGGRVAPLVIVGLGYNSLWERGRRRHAYWGGSLRPRGPGACSTRCTVSAPARSVWVTLRQPTARTVSPGARGELGQYSSGLPVRQRALALPRSAQGSTPPCWRTGRRASDRPGLTYDSIHLNPAGAALMARGRSGGRSATREGVKSARPNFQPTLVGPASLDMTPSTCVGSLDGFGSSGPRRSRGGRARTGARCGRSRPRGDAVAAAQPARQAQRRRAAGAALPSTSASR